MAEENQRLLPPTQTPGKISVKFCVYRKSAPCYPCCQYVPCCSCCGPVIQNAIQIVVPDNITVEEFLRTVSRVTNPSKEYTTAYIGFNQLINSDLLAPSIRSFEHFEVPLVVVPKESCCLLI